MHDPQLETQHSRQAPSALLRLSPILPALSPRETSAFSGYGVPELAHDARNLISALDLYCELLASPGVLAPGFEHYAEDLRRVAGSGACLIEALARPRTQNVSRYPDRGHSLTVDRSNVRRRPLAASRFSNGPFSPIEDLPSELAALEAPLRALAGPDVRFEIECAPCAGRLALTSEDLLRIFFNLVANAVEAMASTPAELRRTPFLRITAQRGGGTSFAAGAPAGFPVGFSTDFPTDFTARRVPQGGETIVLSVRDNGPGIAPHHLEHIFDAGFSTRHRDEEDGDPHGLGLAIVRQLVTAAGGAVRAVSSAGRGARFDIELPLLRTEATGARLELAGSPRAGGMTNDIRALKQIPAQVEKEA